MRKMIPMNKPGYKSTDFRGTGRTRKIEKSGEYKRSNHPDFLTATELKAKKFSGIRHNSITGNAEIWLLGDLIREVTRAQATMNPHALDNAISEVFALGEVRPDIAELRKIRGD